MPLVHVLSYHRRVIFYFSRVWYLPTFINNHCQKFHSSRYNFPLEVMSSFVPAKGHMLEALLCCFKFNKLAAEFYRTLLKAYTYSALSKTTRRSGFCLFNDKIFDLRIKQRKNRPKKVEDHQLQLVWQKLYSIGKNACRAIRCYSTSHFDAFTCDGKDSKYGKMGFLWIER